MNAALVSHGNASGSSLARWFAVLAVLGLGCASRPPGTTTTPALDRHRSRVVGRVTIVAASAETSDAALDAAAARLQHLTAHAPALLANLESAGFSIRIVDRHQLLTDLPELRSHRGEKLEDGETFDEHTRGAGKLEGNLVACSEGNLLDDVGDKHWGDDTCVHELGHAVMWLALDSELRARIESRYIAARSAHLWEDRYGGRNAAELFAELTRAYFEVTHASPTFGPGWLRSYDPESFDLVDRIYGGREPLRAPEREDAALKPAADPLRSVDSRVPTTWTVNNRSGRDLEIRWFDFQGVTRPQMHIGPADQRTVYTFASHAFELLDDTGRLRGTFVASAALATTTVKD
jgi:hypothetical protein